MTGLQTLTGIRIGYYLAFAFLIVGAAVAISEVKFASGRGPGNVGALVFAVALVLVAFLPLPPLRLRSKRARLAASDGVFFYRETSPTEAVTYGPNGADVIAFLRRLSRLSSAQWRMVQDRQGYAGDSLVRRYLTFRRRARAIRALEWAMATAPREAALVEARRALVDGFRSDPAEPGDKRVVFTQAMRFTAAYAAISGIVCGDLLPDRDLQSLLLPFTSISGFESDVTFSAQRTVEVSE